MAGAGDNWDRSDGRVREDGSVLRRSRVNPLLVVVKSAALVKTKCVTQLKSSACSLRLETLLAGYFRVKHEN